MGQSESSKISYQSHYSNNEWTNYKDLKKVKNIELSLNHTILK
jgi:hypothetical protein